MHEGSRVLETFVAALIYQGPLYLVSTSNVGICTLRGNCHGFKARYDAGTGLMVQAIGQEAGDQRGKDLC